VISIAHKVMPVIGEINIFLLKISEWADASLACTVDILLYLQASLTKKLKLTDHEKDF